VTAEFEEEELRLTANLPRTNAKNGGGFTLRRFRSFVCCDDKVSATG
jgi:hypothetical protein